jgi:hypothetical protein
MFSKANLSIILFINSNMFAACTAEFSQAEQIKSALPDAAAPPSSHASHSMMSGLTLIHQSHKETSPL